MHTFPKAPQFQRRLFGILAIAFVLSAVTPLTVSQVFAQSKSAGLDGLGLPTVNPGFNLGGSEPISYEATYELEEDSNSGRLNIKASLGPGWHTYSVTQPPGGPLPTTITIQDSKVEATTDFAPDHEPEIGSSDIWEGIPIEDHHVEVTWTGGFTLTQDFDPETTKLAVEVRGLVCQNACQPTGEELQASFSGYYASTKKKDASADGDKSAAPMAASTIQTDPINSAPLQVGSSHAQWEARLQPYHVAPGQVALLKLTAKLDPGYHVYQFYCRR